MSSQAGSTPLDPSSHYQDPESYDGSFASSSSESEVSRSSGLPFPGLSSPDDLKSHANSLVSLASESKAPRSPDLPSPDTANILTSKSAELFLNKPQFPEGVCTRIIGKLQNSGPLDTQWGENLPLAVDAANKAFSMLKDVRDNPAEWKDYYDWREFLLGEDLEGLELDPEPKQNLIAMRGMEQNDGRLLVRLFVRGNPLSIIEEYCKAHVEFVRLFGPLPINPANAKSFQGLEKLCDASAMGSNKLPSHLGDCCNSLMPQFGSFLRALVPNDTEREPAPYEDVLKKLIKAFKDRQPLRYDQPNESATTGTKDGYRYDDTDPSKILDPKCGTTSMSDDARLASSLHPSLPQLAVQIQECLFASHQSPQVPENRVPLPSPLLEMPSLDEIVLCEPLMLTETLTFLVQGWCSDLENWILQAAGDRVIPANSLEQRAAWDVCDFLFQLRAAVVGKTQSYTDSDRYSLLEFVPSEITTEFEKTSEALYNNTFHTMQKVPQKGSTNNRQDEFDEFCGHLRLTARRFVEYWKHFRIVETHNDVPDLCKALGQALMSLRRLQSRFDSRVFDQLDKATQYLSGVSSGVSDALVVCRELLEACKQQELSERVRQE